LFQRELPLKIGNPFRLLIELLAKPFVLLAKPFNLLRLAIMRGRARPDRVAIASCAPASSSQSVRNRYKKYKYKISANLGMGLNCYGVTIITFTDGVRRCSKRFVPFTAIRNRPSPRDAPD